MHSFYKNKTKQKNPQEIDIYIYIYLEKTNYYLVGTIYKKKTMLPSATILSSLLYQKSAFQDLKPVECTLHLRGDVYYCIRCFRYSAFLCLALIALVFDMHVLLCIDKE